MAIKLFWLFCDVCCCDVGCFALDIVGVLVLFSCLECDFCSNLKAKMKMKQQTELERENTRTKREHEKKRGHPPPPHTHTHTHTHTQQ